MLNFMNVARGFWNVCRMQMSIMSVLIISITKIKSINLLLLHVLSYFTLSTQRFASLCLIIMFVHTMSPKYNQFMNKQTTYIMVILIFTTNKVMNTKILSIVGKHYNNYNNTLYSHLHNSWR